MPRLQKKVEHCITIETWKKREQRSKPEMVDDRILYRKAKI